MKTYIKDILAKRREIPSKDYRFFSDVICQSIEKITEYEQAEHLLFFYPYLQEVDILPLVKKALKTGKKVYFPKVTGETTMEFFKVDSLNDFAEGYKGIKEPIGENCFDKASPNCCMIAPGSVFDKKGNRCGYGKGYYDRYLAACVSDITVIGVCFSMQMVENIPDVKPTDIPMDYVVNEVETIRR